MEAKQNIITLLINNLKTIKMKKVILFILSLCIFQFVSAQCNINFTINSVDCFGASTGSILTNCSGQSPFQYQWDNSSTTANLSGLQAGTYCLTITDNSGCTATQCATVNQPSTPLQGNINLLSPVTCFGGNNGCLIGTASGGVAPYTFLWSNGQIANPICGLPSGIFQMFITDANGCTIQIPALVPQPQPLVAGIFNQTSVTCNGASNALAQVSTNGGTSPYSYIWSSSAGNQTTASATGLSSGIHCVTVIDANNCTDSTCVQILNGQMSVFMRHDSCGGALIDSVRGQSPFFYSWSNGQTGNRLSGVNVGNYTVTVIDALGCSVVDTIYISNQFFLPNSSIYHPNVNGTIITSSCTQNDGAINQSIQGMSNPLFLWNNQSTTQNINNLSSQWYSCSITDANACTVVRNYFVPLDTSCVVRINGYIYDISVSNQCNSLGATVLPNQMIRLQPSGQITFTNSLGFYEFRSSPGNYTIEIVNPGNNYIYVCPSTQNIPVTANIVGNQYSNQNFYLQSNVARDISVELFNIGSLRPGFPFYGYALACNRGQTPISGNLEIHYDSRMVFDSIWCSTISNFQVQSINTLTQTINLTYSNLAPGACEIIRMAYNVPITVPLNSNILFSALINPVTNDLDQSNNYDSLTMVSIGSYDPNEKRVDGEFLTWNQIDSASMLPTENTLHYTIHFQNLGNAEAIRVEIKDTLSTDLLVNTIRNIHLSHPGYVIVEGQSLIFYFDQIMLPAAIQNEPASHGFASFTINRNSNLPLGAFIDNSASIYFDFNPPVVTNTSHVLISQPTEITKKEDEIEFKIYPLPIINKFFIEPIDYTGQFHIGLYDHLGQKIFECSNLAEKREIDVNQLPAGIFFMQIKKENGSIQSYKLFKIK